MREDEIVIVPAQRRPAGDHAYKAWLDLHGLTHADVANDLRLKIGRMVGGGDFVEYSLTASRHRQLGLRSISDAPETGATPGVPDVSDP